MVENQVVIFEMGGILYAIDILHVQEIMRAVEITPVAETSVDIKGVINLRGQVIPVINLSRRLGLPEKEHDQDTRIIVVEVNGKKNGMIVERVLEVGKYTSEEFEPAEGIGASTSFLKGIIKKKSLLLLNLGEVA